jgi:hypothetical protein
MKSETSILSVFIFIARIIEKPLESTTYEGFGVQYSFIPCFWENQPENPRERKNTDSMNTPKDVEWMIESLHDLVGGVYIIFKE